jgi:hypothetical protein
LAANLQTPSSRATALVQTREKTMLTILLIVLLIAMIGGGLGHSRYGYAGWSPAGVLLAVVLVLLFTGHRI